MKAKAKSNITTLDQILDKKYGKKGLPKREEWEQQFESFRLGVLLEEARTKLGMTQEELARRVNSTPSTISRYINGIREPRSETIRAIAMALNTSADYLLGHETKEFDPELFEYMEELKNRPELKMYIGLAKGATKEEVMKAVSIVEALFTAIKGGK